MPLLIVLGLLAIYAIISAVEGLETQTEPFTKAELDEISRLIRGKSQAEARSIFRQYKRNKHR